MIERIMEKITIFGLKITKQQDVACWSQCNNTAKYFFLSQGNSREK
jgi:hypothetical protein